MINIYQWSVRMFNSETLVWINCLNNLSKPPSNPSITTSTICKVFCTSPTLAPSLVIFPWLRQLRAKSIFPISFATSLSLPDFAVISFETSDQPPGRAAAIDDDKNTRTLFKTEIVVAVSCLKTMLNSLSACTEWFDPFLMIALSDFLRFFRVLATVLCILFLKQK